MPTRLGDEQLIENRTATKPPVVQPTVTRP